jgi:hypothetical protein
MVVPVIEEDSSDSIVAEFVNSFSNELEQERAPDDSYVSYHLQRFRSTEEGADVLYRQFNTKSDRLRALTRLNMLVGETETEETAADATDIVGSSTRGRISTKGGVLLNDERVLAALDDAEARREAKEAEAARKATLCEQREAVVTQLKLYKYLPADDAGSRIAKPLRHFLRMNHLTGEEWQGDVRDKLVPHLYEEFQDTARTWFPAPTTSAVAPKRKRKRCAPTTAAAPPAIATEPTSAASSAPPSASSARAAHSATTAPAPTSTPLPAVRKRNRVQRVRLIVQTPPRSRAAEVAAIEMQSAALPNAPWSRRRARSTISQT